MTGELVVIKDVNFLDSIDHDIMKKEEKEP